MSDLVLDLLLGLAALALLVLVFGWISYRGMIHYRIRDEAWLRRSGIGSGEIDESVFDLPWIEEELASPTGYALKVHALEAGADGRSGGDGSGPRAREPRIALFHHGIGQGWITMLRYMELFRAEGWTLVAFDSRGHGCSGGRAQGRRVPRPSYGYFEKADLKAVADWSFARFGRGVDGSGGAGVPLASPRFIAFGESMGAATVLQYAPLDPRLDAVIADCPYSSAIGELDHRLKAAMVPPPFRSLVIRVADALCVRYEGFSLRDADPSRAILETNIPMLFIHGLEDRYVPWRMSVVMAETRRRRLPKAVTELLLVPGAKHGGSLAADRERYAEAVRGFLESALA